MGWNPPNTGYRYDAKGLPIPSQFDPGKLPEDMSPLIRIVGSADGFCGEPFCAIDNASGWMGGWRGPKGEN